MLTYSRSEEGNRVLWINSTDKDQDGRKQEWRRTTGRCLNNSSSHKGSHPRNSPWKPTFTEEASVWWKPTDKSCVWIYIFFIPRNWSEVDRRLMWKEWRSITPLNLLKLLIRWRPKQDSRVAPQNQRSAGLNDRTGPESEQSPLERSEDFNSNYCGFLFLFNPRCEEKFLHGAKIHP